MKVLIVDDAFMRRALKEILGEAGYETVEAGNGREAVEKYGEERPDIVTMDVTKPNEDGIEALKALRARHPQAQVIICSAMGQETLVLEAIKAGAADFVVKPFKAARVVQAIEEAMARPAV